MLTHRAYIVSGLLAGTTVQGLPAHAQQAPPANDRPVDNVIVLGQFDRAFTPRDVSGGASVVVLDDLRSARISNVADALKLVPGLVAQSVSGGEATQLSVRGSGIGKGAFTYGNGVQVLFDGFPITTGFGTPYENFEPNALHHIQVFKGPNAFEFGSTQLGGVINFIQNTGRDVPGVFLRVEAGSYGYSRQQISVGNELDRADYYVSFTNFSTDGYRNFGSAESQRLTGNFGYQINDRLATRFYLSWAAQDQDNIASVTRDQLYNNPRFNTDTGRRKNDGSVLLANKTSYQINDDSSLEFGGSYKHPFLTNGNNPVRTLWHLKDWSAQVKYRREDLVGGDRESLTTVALLHSAALSGSGARISDFSLEPHWGVVTGRIDYGGSDTALLVSNDLELTPKLWLQSGLSQIRQSRENEILNAVAAGVDPVLDETYNHTTPRFGLRYDANEHVQLFGNVTKIHEAPQIIGYSTSTQGVYTGYGNNGDLTYQTSTSYEIGVRGQTDRFQWDVAAYRSRIKDELLTVYIVLPSPEVPNGITERTNSEVPSIHQGLEAALEIRLADTGRHRLSLRQAYTVNDFFFSNEDPAAGRGRLPGLPEYVYQAKLLYNHRSNFYANLDVNAVLDDFPIDYVNQSFAPSYTLYGLTLGYAHPDGKWRVFVDGQNLTDERYAASTSFLFRATPTSAAFTPGVGRNVTAGLTYSF